MDDLYEVLALRYAEFETPLAPLFIPALAEPSRVTMDYFVWVVRNRHRTVVIDTGFTAETAHRRGRRLLRCPGEALRSIGIDPSADSDVVMTHLHYDHAGNTALFSGARFHLQARELAFATGPFMSNPHPAMGGMYEAGDIADFAQLNFSGRLRLQDGDDELFPGIGLELVGGHSPGLQIVKVATARGPVVVAGDACHFYRHLRDRLPFHVSVDLREVMAGYERIEELAGGDLSRIVPGHDRKVVECFPALDSRSKGLTVRLDLAPTSPVTS